MIAPSELLRVLLAPIVVAAILAGIGRWRKWSCTMPLAAGAGFLTGYALLYVPKFPPGDGTDWLFWLAIPVTLLGMLDARFGRRWGWILGIAAGGVMVVIALPLVPGAITRNALWIALPVGALGALACAVASLCHPRIPSGFVVAAFSIIVGGAAVVVMSSNVRIVGVYGIAAAASLGPVAVFIGNGHAPRSVALVAFCLLIGLLTGGIYYADPGVHRTNFAMLTAAPILLMVGVIVPGKRNWPRGIISLLAVAIAVAAVTLPTALSAKKAAEETSDDPYGSYYQQ
jgi:hypothetical protein